MLFCSVSKFYIRPWENVKNKNSCRSLSLSKFMINFEILWLFCIYSFNFIVASTPMFVQKSVKDQSKREGDLLRWIIGMHESTHEVENKIHSPCDATHRKILSCWTGNAAAYAIKQFSFNSSVQINLNNYCQF